MNFRFNVFNDYLKNSLATHEFRFLIKTFSYASLYFFGFGLFISTLLAFNVHTFFLAHNGLSFLALIATVLSMVGLFFYFYQYQQDPLAVNKKFINKIFLLLFGAYTCVFLSAFTILGSILGISNTSLPYIVGGVFACTVVCYTIPASIGFYLKNQKTVFTLLQFLKYCYLIYLVLFFIALFSLIFTGIVNNFLSALLFSFMGVMIFSSPVLTIYRLKNTIKNVDYTDLEACHKWEMFFTFEILIQLMQMALYIIRLLIMLLGRDIRR